MALLSCAVLAAMMLLPTPLDEYTATFRKRTFDVARVGTRTGPRQCQKRPILAQTHDLQHVLRSLRSDQGVSACAATIQHRNNDGL